MILEKLQAGFPHPRDAVEEGVHTLLGPLNADIVARALAHVRAGEVAQLGTLMEEAQQAFDRYGGAACPEQLTAPVLHRVLATAALKPHIYGGKGVGSQGDGTVQFLCRGLEGQARAAAAPAPAAAPEALISFMCVQSAAGDSGTPTSCGAAPAGGGGGCLARARPAALSDALALCERARRRRRPRSWRRT